MKLILVIPPQPATQNIERQAVLFSCYRDGTLLLEGKDGLKPARFFMTPKDNFPWEEFIQKMLVAWQLGEYEDLPREFHPQKRIPPFVTDGLLSETLPNQLKVLATLRQQGYFPALSTKKEK